MPIVGQFGSLAGLGSLILPGGAMESIATVTVGSGGAANADFQDIPGTYQHLQLRMILRTARSDANLDGFYLRMNNDSGSNYASHYLYGTGASALAGASTSGVGGQFHRAPGTNATASVFGGVVIDILDYANTSKNTTARYLGGADLNGSGEIFIGSHVWLSTSAVTRLTVSSLNAVNLLQHSTVALYGIKAP